MTNSSVRPKAFEIFCGTGGVGKTTLATARAVHLARQKKKVLLITIDPSRRLKELLGITDAHASGIVKVKDLFACTFDALWITPQSTLARLATQYNIGPILDNKIVQALGKPYSGMQEILSLLEIEHHASSGNYDTIVIDTAPGKHFVDFLDGINAIDDFFDKSFAEIFNFFAGSSKTSEKKDRRPKFLSAIISTGIKKLLNHAQRMTGEEFISDFVESMNAIYKAHQSFLQAIRLKDVIQNPKKSNWYLVTSIEQDKILEAIELQDKVLPLINTTPCLILNKCLEKHWTDYNRKSKETGPAKSLVKKLQKSMLEREMDLKNFANDHFPQVITFEEVLDLSPFNHVNELASQWAAEVAKG